MAWVTFPLIGGETGLVTLPGMDRKRTDVTQKPDRCRIKKLDEGFCKFNCFEKTVVAVVDWSCISHLQGGYYHPGMLTEDDQPANWICP